MWDEISPDTVNILYLSLGAFTCIFMLLSATIKDRLHFGEANIAIVAGAALGPFAAKALDPINWGNFDLVVLEFSRLVLIIQCFAVALELPKAYIGRHWKSLAWLVGPVMVWGWLISSLLVWLMALSLSWKQCLAVASCFNAIDPVLAVTVVGKSKLAKRIPKHLRDLLLAESASNDVTTSVAFGLSILLIRFPGTTKELTESFFVYTVIYQIFVACGVGILIGFVGQRLLRYAHEHEFIDRESFLVFYLMMALFCVGLGSILGVDDVLLAFCAGYAFDKSGWYREKVEESHVSGTVDLLLNLTFFVFLGAIIPWRSFNQPEINLLAWKLVVGTLLLFLLRRLPAILTLKTVVPDIKTWREAWFYGHFGPIGVGAIFSAALINSPPGRTGLTSGLLEASSNDLLQRTIWPIVTFVVFCSSIVHGSSAPLFMLGRHINKNMTIVLTSSYSKGGDSINWMDRLPRIQSRSKSELSVSSLPAGNLISGSQQLSSLAVPPPTLRRSSEPDRLGPRRTWDAQTRDHGEVEDDMAIERVAQTGTTDGSQRAQRTMAKTATPKGRQLRTTKRGRALAFRIGNTVIGEDEDGNVIKKYDLPPKAGRLLTKASSDDADGRSRFTGEGRRLSRAEFMNQIQAHGPADGPPASEADGMTGVSSRLETKQENSTGRPNKYSVLEEISRRYGTVETPASVRRRATHAIPGPYDTFNDYRDEETAAERRRRVAALGISKSGSDDSSEEDEDSRHPEHESEESKDQMQRFGTSGRSTIPEIVITTVENQTSRLT